MSLDTFNVNYPNQKNQTGDTLALAIEEFSGEVEGTIQRRSVLKGFFPVRQVKGTSTITDKAIGETVLQKVTPGTTPDGSGIDVSKVSLTIDTLILARNTVPLLDSFQTDFDFRAEVAREQGKKHAKFLDQAFFIQAIKAAKLAASPFGTTDGFLGGSTVNLATADKSDPAKVYDAISRLFAAMEAKDVDPSNDGVVLAVRPDLFYTMLQAEQIVNGEYVTADGTKLDGVKMFKMYGCPVVKSNDLPAGSIISGHLLSNARNSNAFDGDFSDVLCVAFSPKALLSGSTVPLTKEVFYDQMSKSWYIDSHCSFSMTPKRPEYAGAVLLT